jgi:hypothetical protein
MQFSSQTLYINKYFVLLKIKFNLKQKVTFNLIEMTRPVLIVRTIVFFKVFSFYMFFFQKRKERKKKSQSHFNKIL